MYKNLKNCLMIIIFCFVCSVGTAFADIEEVGYTTKAYDVDVEIADNYVFHFTETIAVDFQQERHGIYRYITKDASSYEIKNIQVEEYNYNVNDKETCVIEIGDEDVLVKGAQTYSFSYDIVGFKDRDSQSDVLYLDVLPTDWETPIDDVNIVVHFPKKIEQDNFNLHVGQYGANGETEKCEYNFSNDGLTLEIKANGLPQGTGITISAELPEGYWVNPKQHDWPMYVVIGLLLFGVVFSAYNWFRYGRDEKPIKVVEFYPPDDMTPAELGYIVEGIATDEKLSSMILYFANKGYLSIRENGTGQFELNREVEKLPENEEIYSKILFYGLFKSENKVGLKSLPDGTTKIYEKAREQLSKMFERKGKTLFTEKSSDLHTMMWLYYMAISIVPCVLLIFFGAKVYLIEDFLDGIAFSILLGGSVFISSIEFMSNFDSWHTSGTEKRVLTAIMTVVLLAISFAIILYISYENFGSISYCIAFVVLSVVMLIFITIMNSRTEESKLLLGRILGFKEFIETAEVERLRMLSDENPEYFFHIMPYAFVLGLSDKWTERFVNQISVDAPSWYSGNCANPNDIFWYNYMGPRCINSIAHNTDEKIISEMEIDSNDGSGEGKFFVGGGFGGGGGGSW